MVYAEILVILGLAAVVSYGNSRGWFDTPAIRRLDGDFDALANWILPPLDKPKKIATKYQARK